MSIDPERWPALHPFLFGLFPVLFFFSQNAGQLDYGDLTIPILFAVGLAAFCLVVGRVIYRSWRKGAIVASLAVILFFSYGHTYSVLQSELGVTIVRHRYLLPLWTGLFAIGAYAILRAQRGLRGTTGFLNVAAVAVVVMPLLQIGVQETTVLRNEKTEQWEGDLEEDLLQPTTDSLPNIYYIVPDAYVSSKSLSKIYGYENDIFVSFLEESGFYVAEESLANYPRTRLSLPSSLNFNYLDSANIDTYTKSKRAIKDNKIIRIFERGGYETVNIDAGFRLTHENPNADKNVICEGEYIQSQFLRKFTDTTILRPFIRKMGLIKGWSGCVKQVLDNLEKLEAKEPHFVFAHFIAPHGPHRYSLEDLEKDSGKNKKEDYNYVDEVEYINERLKNIIKNIKEKNDRKNVIIIQSDHGNNKTFERPSSEYPPHIPSDTLLNEVMSIFNAYHLPGECKDRLYETITPVNSFRIVLNCYFGTDLRLLPDRAFYVSWDRKSKFNYETYQYQEVTDSARWRPAEQDSTLREASN